MEREKLLATISKLLLTPIKEDIIIACHLMSNNLSKEEMTNYLKTIYRIKDTKQEEIYFHGTDIPNIPLNNLLLLFDTFEVSIGDPTVITIHAHYSKHTFTEIYETLDFRTTK